MGELALRKALFCGRSELDQLDHVCKLVGTPTIETFPGLYELPLFNQLMANMRYYKASTVVHRAALGRETHACLFQQCLVANPDTRASATEILAGKYFCASGSSGEGDMERFRISTEDSDNYHEFQIKSKLKAQKQLEVERKLQLAEEALAKSGGIDPSDPTVAPNGVAAIASTSESDSAADAVDQQPKADAFSDDDAPIVIPSFKRHNSGETGLPPRPGNKRKVR